MAQKAFLTPTTIEHMPPGTLGDSRLAGLFIDKSDNGRAYWRYRRRIVGSRLSVVVRLGAFPTHSIAAARAWASALNEKVESGIDPRTQLASEIGDPVITVRRAHALYMVAVREGRASKAKKANKPRTVDDKLKIFARDIEPFIGSRPIHEISETELVNLVISKGRVAKVRANRLAGELKVFFGWASSLRGLEVGLESDPSHRLADLKFPEQARSRTLTMDEIMWFLEAVALEPRDHMRAMLLWLLTAARISEVGQSRPSEIVKGIWTIPAHRSKNGVEHSVPLGPWSLRLFRSNDVWCFPAPRGEGPRLWGWYQARNRVKRRMEDLAGYRIPHFTPHDFRRTVRSNTKRLGVDFETAEAMLNHVKKGLERTYDRYSLEDEKRASFLKWESEIAAIAMNLGLSELLDLPLEYTDVKVPCMISSEMELI